jgi:hypothetical protein
VYRSGRCGRQAFYHGAKGPAHLADLIERSLAQNPSGTTMLDEKKCKDDGSCGTPHLYLIAITQAYKQANLAVPITKVEELPQYLRTKLVAVDAPAGEHFLSCIKYDNEGNPYVVMDCVKRSITHKVWVDGRAWLAILDEFCTNPLHTPVPPKREPFIPMTILSSKCINGYQVTANAWSLTSPNLPEDLRKKVEDLIAAAKGRPATADVSGMQVFFVDDVSRTLGKRLREEVKTRAPVTADIRIHAIHAEPKIGKLEMSDIGVLQMVNGVGVFKFSADPRQYVAIGTVWPDQFISPTVALGAPRLWIKASEWGDACAAHMHGFIP